MCLPPLNESVVSCKMPSEGCNGDIQVTKPQPDAPPAADFYSKRLVFFGVAETKTELALLQLFSQHGHVTDMFVVRSALGISSGCGHVTFATPDQAAAALKALAGSTECAEPGTPLGVLLVEEAAAGSSSSKPAAAAAGADTAAAGAAPNSPSGSTAASDAPSTQAQAEPKSGKSVFFTKVPPTVTSQQLIQLFSACGEVAHLELFIPWPGAKISRGCGLVEFTDPKAAASAVHSLHQRFTWPHSHSALVVEWVDRSRQGGNGKGAKGKGPGRGPEQQLMGHHHQLPPHAQLNHLAAGQGHFHWTPAQHPQQQQQVATANMNRPFQQPQLQQQQGGGNGHSCPLPQLPPGWQVLSTASQLPAGSRVAYSSAVLASQWPSPEQQLNMHMVAGPAGAASHAAAGGPRSGQQQAGLPVALQQQQQALTDTGAMQLVGGPQPQQQQQQLVQRVVQPQCGSEASSSSLWLACPATQTLSATSMDLGSITSLSSGYDTTTLLSNNSFSSGPNPKHTVGPTLNNGMLHAQLAQQQQQQQASSASSRIVERCAASQDPSFIACPAPGLAHARMLQGQQQQQLGQQQFAGRAVCMASGGVAGSSDDAVWQQLLQQNVLLLQTMTPPPEDQPLAQSLVLPAASYAMAQQEGLTGAVGDVMMAPAGGVMAGGMHPHLLPLSQGPAVRTSSAFLQPQLLQQQEMQQAQATQLWFVPTSQAQQQQQQQQATESSVVMAIPLSHRQLAAMAGVLPEVPKLTGAQAWISSGAGGGVQLCLGGNYGQLQAGRTAVAMLLGRSGVDEPLAAPVVHAGP